MTAQGTHVVTQADVDAGVISNTATATATSPDGGTISQAGSSTVIATADPGLAVSKTAAPATAHAVGDVLTYSIGATNTGNVTETDVVFTDPLAGLGALTISWPGPAGILNPGETAVATGSYTITQADVDSGGVVNTSTVTATTPDGGTIDGSATATVPIVQSPELSVAKTASPATVTAVGDVVTYTISATNSGNATLTGVVISDPLSGLSNLSYAWPATPGTLTPGQTVTATATYTATQADLDRGTITNTATAAGTTPGGTPVSGDGTSTVTVDQAPGLTVAKTAAPASVSSIGQQIAYTVTAVNTGNVTLSGVAVADPLPGLSGFTYIWPGAAGTLDPGQVLTASATHAVTQADLDAGSIANTATVTGTTPRGGTISGDGTATVPANQTPSISLVKTGALGTGAVGRPGDTVVYTFTATNTGNVTLTDVTIDDPLAGLSAITYVWPSAPGTLAPGASVTAQATYILTQEDVDAGSIENTAAVAGAPPAVGGVTGPPVGDTSEATVDIPAHPAITIAKTGMLTLGSVGAPGDVVNFTVTITNTGNTTLHNVAATDTKAGLSSIVYDHWPGGVEGTLAAGQSVTAHATYPLSQADIDAGSVSNTASANGTPDNGDPVSDDATTTVAVPQHPGLSVVKRGALDPGQKGDVGDTVVFSFVVTNTGNITLTGVHIDDHLTALSPLVYGAWPEAAAGTLPPGESVTATATWIVTPAAAAAGSITNSASATGQPPSGPPIDQPSNTVVVPTVQPPPASTAGGTGSLSATGSDPTGAATTAVIAVGLGIGLVMIGFARTRRRNAR